MMTRVLLFCFSLFINGVFGDVDVKVMKGDSVTLHVTSEEIKGAEKLIWIFTNKEIAKIDLEAVNTPAEYPDDRFKDRLYLSRKDRSLTINNMRTEDRGEYKLEIRSSGPSKYKTFNVNVFGVFGNVKVSVMTGEDVTLHVTFEEIKRAEKMTWTFTDKEIANIDVKNQPAKYPDDTFKRRLYLSPENGSLTIYNIRTEDSGVYKLKIISSGEPKYKIFNVTVTDQEIKVSVVKGNTFTLPTGVNKHKDDVIEWKFNDTILTDWKFTNIHVSNNGDLNITNIGKDQSGKYDVKINGTNLILHKTFRVNVSGEVFKVSVMKGDSFTLQTGVDKQKDDKIKWKFNDTILTNGRFTNNGDLNITNITEDQSGKYDVKITGRNLILHKTFRVNVNDEVKLSKIKGDEVTLKINEKLHRDDVVEWKFNSTLIAKPNETINDNSMYIHERFKERLNVTSDGSLIIKNIKTEDSGIYDVNFLNSTHIINKRFNLTVTDEVKLSKKKGDEVTLKINEKLHRDDVIEWKFNNTLIAKPNKAINDNSMYIHERFKERLDVNWFGSLNIKNLKTEDSGIYDVNILNSAHIINKRFHLTVTDSSSSSHQMKIGPGLLVLLMMLVKDLL